MLDRGGLGETLAKLVGTDRVLGLGFRQVPQHRFRAAAGIEDAIDRLVVCRVQTVDDTHRSQDQLVDVACFDERHLIKSQTAAIEQCLPQRAPLLARFDQKRRQCVAVNKLKRAQQITKLPVARIDFLGHG